MDIRHLFPLLASEEKAVELIEQMRWPSGPVCPHCENRDKIYNIKSVGKTGKPRYGLRKCGLCRKQFTVRVGTIFEDSHIQLRAWVLALHRMCVSKKGVSAKQLETEFGLSYKAAWFMCHRIRYAMTQAPMQQLLDGLVEGAATRWQPARRPPL